MRGWTESPAEIRDRALVLAQKAVALDRSSPQVHWALGFVYLVRKQTEDAIQAVERATALAPNYADGYGLIALIDSFLGRSDKAIRLIEKAIELNPYYTFEYPNVLGIAYYASGRYSEAAEALEEATERNENAVDPHLFLAASYVRLGRQDDAEWEIDQVRILEPGYTLSHFANTSRFKHRDHLDVFLEDLRKAGLPE